MALIRALFVERKTWKQFKCPTKGNYLKKWPHMLEYGTNCKLSKWILDLTVSDGPCQEN